MRLLSLLVVSGLLGTAHHAYAEEVNCGCRAGNWNAPEGALVLSRSDSVVGRALVGAGESSSHSMLSHGNGATHASLDTDKLIKKGWPDYCSGGPITESSLRDGRPGMQWIYAAGAAYAYLMLSADPVLDLWWQLPPQLITSPFGFTFENPQWTWARKVSKTMSADLMYEYMRPEYLANGSNLTLAAGDFWYTLYPPGGYRQPYFLHQFMNIMGRHQGGIPANTGAVCSTSIAWGQYLTGYAPPFGTANQVPYEYSHNTLLSIGSSIYSGAQSKCDQGAMNEFAGASCLGESICDDFGRQVRNCAAAGKCGTDSSSTWSNIANNANAKPYTISPARLGGWNGHGETGNTPWAGEAKRSMVWAGPGNVCSCWSIR